MAINVAEITSVLKREIQAFEQKLQISEVGTVVEVGDGIARIYGLQNAMAGELLEFQDGTMGQVFNLEDESIGAVIFGNYLAIKEGDSVKSTGRLLESPVGEAVIGRVVNPLGKPLDGGPPIPMTETRKMDIVAPGIAERQPVKEPLQTGIKAIDAMIPIGRGQRELIIGDRKTGKTAIAVDTIIAQKGAGVKCFYVAVGQKESTVAGIVEVLRAAGAMEYTTVVVASAADPAPLQYIAAYAGCAMAEYFMWKGEHTLVVYDDLSKQAAAYRQLSLLLRRPPGREAYPGDVFYLHSRLLERAVKLPRRQGRRVAYRTADHRDAGRRSLRLYSHERDQHHRWTDLFRAGSVLRRRTARDQRRYQRLARRWKRPDESHEEDRRLAATGPGGLSRVGSVLAAWHRAGCLYAAHSRSRRPAGRAAQAAAVQADADRT